MKKIELNEYQKKLITAIKKGIIKNPRLMIATIKSVAKSGMSRVISFYYISKNKDLHNLDFLISLIAGNKLKDNGVFVKGCGMDMIFATLDSFYKGIGLKDFTKLAGSYTRI